MRRLALAALLVLAACGDGDSKAAPPTFRTGCPDAVDATAPELTLDTAAPPRMGDAVTWELTLTNQGPDAVTLVFGSSQLGDVALEMDGEEIYRWSRERVFAQSLRCFDLAPGKSARLDLGNDQLEINPGEYKLTATVNAQPEVEPVKRSLTVAGK